MGYIFKYKLNTKATKKQQTYQQSREYDNQLNTLVDSLLPYKIIRILLFIKGLFTMDKELMSKMLDQELGDNEVDELRNRLRKLMASKPYVRETPKIGRNEPCTCGSSKKYKHCCGK